MCTYSFGHWRGRGGGFGPEALGLSLRVYLYPKPNAEGEYSWCDYIHFCFYIDMYI